MLDYYGFLFCAHKEERVDGLNFSLCYGKSLEKWNKKYEFVGISLAWSQFFRDKLSKQSKDGRKLLKQDFEHNIVEQMKLFRKLLPMAMNLALFSKEAKSMPSFNNEPEKVDLKHLTLYDNGCDRRYQGKINLYSDDKDQSLEAKQIVSNDSDVTQYKLTALLCVTVGIVLIAGVCIRCYSKRRRLDRKLNSILRDKHGRTETTIQYNTFET